MKGIIILSKFTYYSSLQLITQAYMVVSNLFLSHSILFVINYHLCQTPVILNFVFPFP